MKTHQSLAEGSSKLQEETRLKLCEENTQLKKQVRSADDNMQQIYAHMLEVQTQLSKCESSVTEKDVSAPLIYLSLFLGCLVEVRTLCYSLRYI